jgi:hypothetical protein
LAKQSIRLYQFNELRAIAFATRQADKKTAESQLTNEHGRNTTAVDILRSKPTKWWTTTELAKTLGMTNAAVLKELEHSPRATRRAGAQHGGTNLKEWRYVQTPEESYKPKS